MQLYTQRTSDLAAESGRPEAERIALPGADGTLLAIVPIPGTQTSLAIVGYAISTAGAPPHPPAPGLLAPGREISRPGPLPHEAATAGPDHDAHAVQAGQPGRPDSGLFIDHPQRRVLVSGTEVALTFQEFELLAFLSAHPAVVFSRADLVERVWQQPQDAPDRPTVRLGTRTVDVHVSRLRRKLGPVYGQCLVTEHRAGYQFRPLPA
jgi:hypothetical protein